MKLSGIYKIQSIIKYERVYIGSAINISKRWGTHLCNLRKNKHENSKLQNHFNKYGEVDLVFSILLGCEKEDLIKTEQYFIDSYNPYFNICKKAGSLLGTKRTDESREKMSNARKDKYAGENAYWFGKHRSKELMNKFNAKGLTPWNKGKKGCYSEETLGKIRAARKLQVCPRRGKKTSEETKYKQRLAKLGKKQSPDVVSKRVASFNKTIALRKIS